MMHARTVLFGLAFLAFTGTAAITVSAQEIKDQPVIGHTVPALFKDAPNAHDGAGVFKIMELIPGAEMKTNFLFVHRGVIPPHVSIGEHLHKNMEEMFIIYTGRAQFTVNGHTAELPARSLVLCPVGSSHGIYNDTDQPVEWMNVGVSLEKGKYISVEYKEDLTKAKVESPAPFLWANLDRSLLNPVANAHQGKGTLGFRRLWANDSFKTPWYFVDHCLLPPGTSIGYHQHGDIEEIYYIVEGSGLSTVNGRTFPVKAGDAIPCRIMDSHGIYNNSNKDLEVLVNCVALEKNTNKKGQEWGDDLSKRKPTNDDGPRVVSK
jgi:mannose-6-phosphate isomerase-like protein (cupin superfamily)